MRTLTRKNKVPLASENFMVSTLLPSGSHKEEGNEQEMEWGGHSSLQKWGHVLKTGIPQNGKRSRSCPVLSGHREGDRILPETWTTEHMRLNKILSQEPASLWLLGCYESERWLEDPLILPEAEVASSCKSLELLVTFLSWVLGLEHPPAAWICRIGQDKDVGG